MPSNDLDYEIIENILNGQKEDFEKIVDKYQNKVFAIIGRRVPQNDIPDVAQDAFLRIYRGLTAYIPRRPFENWLSVVTLRSCYDFWRRQVRNKEITAPDIVQERHYQWLEKISADMSSEAFTQLSNAKEARELLVWALAKLEATDRTIIEMVYLDGYSFNEVAEVMEWKLSKTKVRALRARKKLRKIISEYTENIYNERK
jgi:RNA polymerase sigma-70 factor (ECF subfamily)